MPQLKKILIVDDEESIIACIVRWICTYFPDKYEPLVAMDGHEALESMRRKEIALVLLDLQMSNLDGISVCRQAKEDPRLKGIPILISSGGITDQRKEHLLSLGVEHFLEKPYRMERLFTLIDQILAPPDRS